MIFVDGSNLLSGIGKRIGKEINAAKPTYNQLCLGNLLIDTLWSNRLRIDPMAGAINGQVIRRYWFGSFIGDDKKEQELKQQLRNLNYEPVLFKKTKDKEKRVDIAISTELLENAQNRLMESAILVSGDEDFVDTVKKVKKYGIIITGSFFEEKTSPLLKVEFDYFDSLQIWGKSHKELIENIRNE